MELISNAQIDQSTDYDRVQVYRQLPTLCLMDMTTAETNIQMASAIQTSSQNNESNLFASMPRDILLAIFEEDVGEKQGVVDALSHLSPIWRLGQVCTHWRQSLRSHPVLWSRLCVNFGNFPAVKPRVLESRFRKLVQLSGTSVLHIRVLMAASSTCDLGDRIAGALRDVAERIGELGINFASYIRPPGVDRATSPLPVLQSELLKNCVFSALHTLTIAIPFGIVKLGDADPRVDAFSKSPLLRCIHLQEESHHIEFVLPYENITTVDANGGRFDYIISKLKKATDVNLNLCPRSNSFRGAYPPEVPFRSTPTWQPDALKTLKRVRFRSFMFDVRPGGNRTNIFLSLHAHTLRTLEFVASSTQLIQILEMIPDIALRGLHELIAFCVHETPAYMDGNVQSFMHVMTRMPALRSLSISERFGHYVLCALKEGSGLVPALAVLKISPELLKQDGEMVVCIARERRDTLSFEVIVSNSYPSWGPPERFVSTVLESDAAIFWKELVALVSVRVV
ncbi:hypothetical protein CYLTODRAFT_43286 [Cylindrobasidium torrendii FP15055 ss-10]|uniref:F-box domain-containing protein n=1 Tax=Cylindrobasidium torrendii FP15055 ss-10 TaxID=1314674 RepID=A0A0D7B965_9AGAR|nr:hypothetical protein CYLTODRAFT_43286 [Cylindrobasidium torrendii FP15055 ss-10]